MQSQATTSDKKARFGGHYPRFGASDRDFLKLKTKAKEVILSK
jgi:hypothetical protein